MSSVVVTVRIEPKSAEAERSLLRIIDKIIEYARTESGVLRYLVGKSTKSDSQETIHLVEEYASEELRLAHLASEPVKELLSQLSPESEAINSAPQIHVLHPSLSFQRSAVVEVSQAQLVIMASFGYQDGRTSHALHGWMAIVDNCEANEPQVLGYAVLEDAQDNTIRTVEVYSDAELASGDHVKSAAVKYNQDQNGGDRDGRKEVVKLKPVAGFLGRA